ncbi:MAG: ATP-dependent sacrificial sulfur transferase LarE [Deltaproteobacteria bacterium]|nr:ATP-dependent sacrificial sulfur transferase LarE [Deltaproteobacteria bacterium]
MDEAYIRTKRENLIRVLKNAGSVLVAFSGGVDSSLLLAVAHETLGSRVVAVTAVSEIYPKREKEAARNFALDKNIEHIVLPSKEISLSAFASNKSDRCYHCKRNLFEKLIQIAEQRGIACVAHGANLDDGKDYRPGLKAAEEMGILAPLAEAELRKDDIRLMSKQMGLSTWDRPPMACLATRIPYGNPVTVEKLKMIDEAEIVLFGLGVEQCRVRHHGSVARIELETSDITRIMQEDLRHVIISKFREIGFLHIALDLEGYISGSMNRMLEGESHTKDSKGVKQ